MNESLEKVTVSAAHLKALREARGLKQNEVADTIGVTKSALSMYERGRQRCPSYVLARLSILYGEPIEQFIEEAAA